MMPALHDASRVASRPASAFRIVQARTLGAPMLCYLFFYTGRQNFGWTRAHRS